MFINYTNHPSANWGEKQIRQASEYGEIVDIHFPAISPEMSRDEIYELACRECERILCILEYEKDSAVLCQGEFSFTYLMVHFLQSKKIKVFTAVSERKVKELSEGDISRKEVEFCFQGFREYDDRRMKPKSDEELHPSVHKKEFNRKKKEETILITQLGLGGYQNTTYIDEKGNRIANTGYAFDAVVQKENPDKIISAAQKWNEDIEQKVVKSLEVLEEKASDCGYKNLSEYFNCSFHNKERSSYSWDLWSSLRSMDDILGYGTDCAVYDENGNWTVMMPEVIKKEALSHPENFVILQLIYD